MNIHNGRLEDLSKVFDRTWKASHNDDVKNARVKEKNFINRMFNVKEEEKSTKNVKSPGERANDIQNNLNGMRKFNNQNRINNMKGKFN